MLTDHHELPEELPDCVIVNPKNADDYPYDNLCGAGVAFKVACALLGEKAYDLLDFAALATVADSVPLLGENRDIVTEGLKLFNADHRSCFTYLLAADEREAGRRDYGADACVYAGAAGERAGRMGNSNAAYELFIAEEEERKREIAAKLCAYNVERQKKCDELYLAAKQTLAAKGAYSHVIMLTGDDWNAGFVGIVAARIAEEYNPPHADFRAARRYAAGQRAKRGKREHLHRSARVFFASGRIRRACTGGGREFKGGKLFRTGKSAG